MQVSSVDIAGAGLRHADARVRHGADWHLSAASTGTWAATVALLMSTQYLVQPFVWTHWTWDEVVLGWCAVIVERLIVALSIAAALVLATRLPASRTSVRAWLVAVAIFIGALAGETLIALLARLQGMSTETPGGAAIVRWSLLAACVAGMYYAWARSHRAQASAREEEHARSSADAQAVKTELEALRRQIDPHFLFNTLATIRHLKETESAEGTRVLAHLIDYLDAAGKGGVERATLGDELDLVSSHLAIVGSRMGGRLAVYMQVPRELRTCTLPPLSLATLVENAITHGIMPMQQGGRIVVRAMRKGDALEVSVEDDGAGMREAHVQHGGTGIGLANLRARLRTLYGHRARLTVTANHPRGVRASVLVPIQVAARERERS